MPGSDHDKIRLCVAQRLAELDVLDTANPDGRDTVHLDQSSVGRLSRMDALQQQAMAQAPHARRRAERARLIAALARLNRDPDYGQCRECGEEIPLGRLLLDPAAARCVSCA